MDLITDRTEADAMMGTEKGMYGYTDLNRVESAIEELGKNFSALGLGPAPEVKTDWGIPGDFSESSWPVESQMNRYLGNIKAIAQIFPNNVKLPSSMDGLTWSGANNIEKVLQIAAGRISGIKQAWKYSGEVFAGEG